MLKKNIITQRLCICQLDEAHVDDIIEIITDATVKKTYMLPDLPDRESAVRLFRRLLALSGEERHYIVGIRLGDRLIGFINDTEISEDGRSLELGWAFNPEFYGQGYATEAVTAIIDYLFGEGFSEVTAGAFESNLASQRVMEKSGMVRVDKTDEIDYRGETHRCVYYSKKAQ